MNAKPRTYLRLVRLMAIPGMMMFVCNCFAGDQLTIKNGGTQDLEFLWHAAADDGWSRTVVANNNEVVIDLNEGDPYYEVQVRLPPNEKQVTVSTRVGRLVRLNRIARAGRSIEIKSAIALVEMGGVNYKDLGQVMIVDDGGATLDVQKSIQANDPAHRAATRILQGQWKTSYTAINGTQQKSIDDFGKGTIAGDGFTGTYSHIKVSEAGQEVYVSGRWHAGGSSGDFFLRGNSQNLNVLSGHYFEDRQVRKRKFEWISRR